MAAAEQIDEAILASVTAHWLKVARVVVDTLDKLQLPYTDENFEKVELRVRALAEKRLVKSQGDLSKPHYSEVRLPGAEDR